MGKSQESGIVENENYVFYECPGTSVENKESRYISCIKCLTLKMDADTVPTLVYFVCSDHIRKRVHGWEE